MNRWERQNKCMLSNNVNTFNVNNENNSEDFEINFDQYSSSSSSGSEILVSDSTSCSSNTDLSLSDFSDLDSSFSDSQSSADDSCGVNNETFFKNLYSGSNISVDEAVLRVLDMLTKHNLSKSALKAQLSLINDILPIGHKMPKTLYYFFKYLEDLAPPCQVIKNFFCRHCLIFHPKEVDSCHNCSGKEVSFFYEIDMFDQIIRSFEHNNLAKKLMKISTQDEFICDIVDGSEYRRVNANRSQFDLTLIMYTDGISLIKSSSSHCWPLMFVIAELPPQIRYKNIIIAGVWYDCTIKPSMNLFLRPFCQKLKEKQTVEWQDPISGTTCTSKIIAPLFIADAPARAQIQNILNFNGSYGCNICEIKTVACKNAR